ncbi:cyclase family protein [Candidatus Bathyarchaeota archaeon]|nr:cyclase family protein [Candidatus Bathyarchaeota archaeon]
MLKGYKIIDLSHQLFNDMPSYPSLPKFRISQLKVVDRNGSNVSIITSMHTHMGTHIDLPLHVFPGSRSLDEYSLEDLSGEGVVIDLTYKKEGGEIDEEDLIKYRSHIKRGNMLFLFTGWSKKRGLTSTYMFEWPYLNEEAARFLVKRGIKILGTDGLSVGSLGGKAVGSEPASVSSSRRVHRTLLGAGILLVEEVANLDKILMGKNVAKAFFIIAPLSIKGVEASPCRVISLVRSF